MRVYPGADGEFTLAEDRDDDRWARTRMTYDDASGELTVHDVEGDAGDAAGRPQLPRRGGAARPHGVDERVFALLDRAQMGFELKAAAYDAVRAAPDAGRAVLALQALDLSPALLGALSEMLLAR